MLLTWFDFGPVCCFYPVVFVLGARISKEVAADFCSSSQIEVCQLVLWHVGSLQRNTQDCFQCNSTLSYTVHLVLKHKLVQCKGHITLSRDVSIIALVVLFCPAFVSHTVQTWTMTHKPVIPPHLSPERWLHSFFSLDILRTFNSHLLFL